MREIKEQFLKFEKVQKLRIYRYVEDIEISTQMKGAENLDDGAYLADYMTQDDEKTTILCQFNRNVVNVSKLCDPLQEISPVMKLGYIPRETTIGDIITRYCTQQNMQSGDFLWLFNSTAISNTEFGQKIDNTPNAKHSIQVVQMSQTLKLQLMQAQDTQRQAISN